MQIGSPQTALGQMPHVATSGGGCSSLTGGVWCRWRLSLHQGILKPKVPPQRFSLGQKCIAAGFDDSLRSLDLLVATLNRDSLKKGSAVMSVKYEVFFTPQ